MSRRPRLLMDAGPYSLSATGITGIGVRLVELAQTLAVRFRVRVLAGAEADCVPVAPADLVSVVDWKRQLAESDVVFFFDMPDQDRLAETARAGKLIVTENAPPVEHLEYPTLLGSPDPAGRHRDLVAGFTRQLRTSHHFLCRSQAERVALIASLCLAGRLTPDDIRRSRTLAHLVSTIPIGFSAGSAATAAAAKATPLADVLWTGGLWSYFDPLRLVDALALCHAREVGLTAAFLYARPGPDNMDTIQQLAARIAALGLTGAVRLVDRPLRHQDRDGVIKGARALVCIARPGIENETCVRLRIRDSRLYGLPTVVDSAGPTAGELTRDGLGRALTGRGPEELADVLIGLTSNGHCPPGPREDYTYDRTIGNLTTWLEGCEP